MLLPCWFYGGRLFDKYNDPSGTSIEIICFFRQFVALGNRFLDSGDIFGIHE
jgi:hypothetical protein